MKYMLQINSDESYYATISEADMGQIMAGYAAFDEAARAAGVYVDSHRLQPISTATTVRVRDGKSLITDGPFAETKEQFGGYYLLDVEDLDAALEWAARIPSATYGSVEVRPIWDM